MKTPYKYRYSHSPTDAAGQNLPRHDNLHNHLHQNSHQHGVPGSRPTVFSGCLSKIGLKTGIGTFIFIVVLSFNLMGWNLSGYLIQNGEKRKIHLPGDEVSLSGTAPQVNSALCRQMIVTTSTPSARIYLIHERNKATVKVKEVHFIQMPPGSSRVSRRFYWLEGSMFQVSVHCGHRGQGWVTLVKGTDPWQTTQVLHVDENTECNKTLLYQTMSNDDFLDVQVIPEAGRSLTATLQIDVDRERFDIQRVLSACYEQEQCSFDLKYNHDQDILVVFQDDPTNALVPILLQKQCVFRLPFWIAMFGVVPAIISLFSLIVCWVCGRSANHSAPKERSRALPITNKGFDGEEEENKDATQLSRNVSNSTLNK